MFPIKVVESGILALLKERFSPTIYNIWFSDLVISSMTEEKILFKASSDFKKNILLTQYRSDIEKAISDSCGFPFPFEISVGDEDVTESGLSVSELPKNTEDIGPSLVGPTIFKEYSFDNFIVGESNKFAHAACVAVSRSMASYNPLFIYGESGLGKTHLLFAITNELKKNNPNIRIVYKKGDEFTNELVDSLHHGGDPAAFRQKYRSADVLLIDDIQFIAGKEGTQEEFFHTFSALYEAEKQIILTSDRPPKDIRALEERLRTRFEWGLIADIQPPSLELRIAIIKKKSEYLKIRLSEEQINRMAERLSSNIRKIEGALKKIAALSLLNSRSVTDDEIEEIINHYASRAISSEDVEKKIFKMVSEKYDVTVDDIKSSKRNSSIAIARHVTVYLLHEVANYSFSKIGSVLNRDHTTVLASNANINDKMKKDTLFEEEMDEMMKVLRS